MHSNYLIDSGEISKFAMLITWNSLFQSPEKIISKLEALLQKEATEKSYRIIKSLNNYSFKNIAVSSSSEAVLQELQPLITKFNLTKN
jgi:ribosomal protein L20A (L18A)